ncbi:hypothetical protein WA026_021116 [Henosepilachna vigintioctopunctata]|uniref:Uncharacterized protein n=1 Tax=Henosepilachna vigintioctopunctata TaxID=420089 RepID=A0AAW1V5X3_9CUCU
MDVDDMEKDEGVSSDQLGSSPTETAAHNFTWAEILANGIDIVAFSEPNKKLCVSNNWFTDKNKDVAVITPNRNIRIDSYKAGDGYVRLKLKGFTFLAAYISPNIGLDAFKLKIDALFRGTPNRVGKYIIVGDLDAKSASWGSPI